MLKFYPSQDSPGYDICYAPDIPFKELLEQALVDPRIRAVNTQGYCKSWVRNPKHFSEYPPGGIYVKTNPAPIRIRILCNWTNAYQELQKTWKPNTPNFIFEFIDNDYPPDYYLVINATNHVHDPKKTFVFHMEPNIPGNDLVWGDWARVNEDEYLYIGTHKKQLNMLEWHLSKNIDQLLNHEPKKTHTLSAILSAKTQDPGQRFRTDLVNELLMDDSVELDLYGTHPEASRKLPYHEKDEGLFPYKYTINVENYFIENYVTEKLVDAILSECLCFYLGAPNVSKHFAEKSFILLPFTIPHAIKVIKYAIKNDEWEQRIDVIRAEKTRILTQMSFCSQFEDVFLSVVTWSQSTNNIDLAIDKFLNYKTDGTVLSTGDYFQGYFGLHRGFHVITCNNIPKLTRENLTRELKGVIRLDLVIVDAGLILMLMNTLRDLFVPVDLVYVIGGYPGVYLPEYTVIHKIGNDHLAKLSYLNDNMNCHVINLDRRRDRWEAFVDKARTVRFTEYKRKPAVDGRDLDLPYKHIEEFYSNDFGWKAPVIGCAKSHIELWREFIDSDHYDHLIVFEDDVEFHPNFRSLLRPLLDTPFDLVFIGYHDMFSKFMDKNIQPFVNGPVLIRVNQNQRLDGAFGYIIRKPMAKRLLDIIREKGCYHGIDYFMYRNATEMTYRCLPELVTSDFYLLGKDTDTDIQN